MLTLQNKSIFAFVRWLTHKYIQLENVAAPSPLKIAALHKRNNHYIVKIGFSGQSHTVDLTPQEIIDQNIFEYFSSHEKKIIFSLKYHSSDLSLSNSYFCNQTTQTFAVITENPNGNIITLPIHAISGNEAIINRLSQADAHRVGYLSGIDISNKINYLTDNISQ